MSNYSIAFVTCVNNEDLYKECVRYIDNLNVPSGYEVEKIPLRGKASMTSAYNEAITKSNSKYKIYLHQDTFIINKNFIFDCLSIFEENKQVGMLGVIGAETVPISAIWWDSQHKKGKVYESSVGRIQLLDFDSEDEERYTEVQSIDGLIMITQYDVNWKEDIFDGWHFYDIAQCMEFINEGYKIAIPNQEEPWCVHDSGIANIENGYEKYRNIFIEEYFKNLFPLVSILIPTYNRPEYFKIALESAINQSYKNIEIIIGDDSDNNDTQEIIKEYLEKYDNIRYYHNENNLGQFDNDLKLMEMAKGEYINFLMDDDVFEPTKIEKMMFYFINDVDNNLSIVSSNRKIIDSNGKCKNDFIENEYLNIIADKVVDGKKIMELMISCSWNFIGEPTTALFKKNKLTEKFGVYYGRKFICNVDQASWFNLLKNGDALILSESLSSFRKHDGQQQEQEKIMVGGIEDIVFTVLNAQENGLFENDVKYATVIKRVAKHVEHLIEKYPQNEKGYLLRDKVTSKLSSQLKKLPLVSILIPAYNQTKYLKKALESAINQTYANIEIIIGDDSTTNEVEEFIKPYLKKYENIAYFKNNRNEMDYGYKNHVECFKRSKGEYINYLNHDDVFHTRKIEKMIKYFMENPNITLVTSVRKPIDENGNEIDHSEAFSKLFDKDTIISGYKLSKHVVTDLINSIGEPTTVLFKRRYIEEGKYGWFNNVRFWNIADVANWFTLLEYGDAVYISDTLSYFRVHPDQSTNMSKVFIKGCIAWYDLIKSSYEKGIINLKEYKTILNKWFMMFVQPLNEYLIDNDNVDVELKDEIAKAYKEAADEMIYKKDEKNFECPICRNKIERFLPYQYKEHTSDFTYKFRVIGSNTENFTCPYCNCHDRVRHLVMYFNKLNIWEKYIINKNILHIAPEEHIQQIISNLSTKNYVCGDLYPVNDSIKKVDITNISFDENYFDFIMCNHVLEHIPNDLKAMKEIYRVLKKGGCAIVQTPYSPNIKESFEDEIFTTENDRRKFFGQSDHVRIYGSDLFERLKSVGFKLDIISNSEIFTSEESKRYGINDKEELILVTKE